MILLILSNTLIIRNVDKNRFDPKTITKIFSTELTVKAKANRRNFYNGKKRKTKESDQGPS